MKHTFYGIGVGPGDKELMTLKAVERIKKASTVFLPLGKDKEFGLAYEIAKDYIDHETPIVGLEFPMIGISENREVLENKWRENAARIALALQDGDVVFLTIGDPFLYSTYSYLLEFLRENPTFNIETIPGITSFSALSSRVGVPLALGEESLAIVSLTEPEEKIREILKNHQNIIVMKASGKSALLADTLEEMGLEENFIIVSNLGLENEKITTDLEDLRDGVPYLSTIFIKKGYVF